jgi:hypothetical protein
MYPVLSRYRYLHNKNCSKLHRRTMMEKEKVKLDGVPFFLSVK